MKYAVVKTGGKQYKVSEGDVIEVDRLSGQKDGKLVFEDVFLLVSEDNVKIGTPLVSGQKVEGKLLEHFKGDKVRVSKFKSKVRYRNVTGFRAHLSRVRIEKIGLRTEKPAAKAKTAKIKS